MLDYNYGFILFIVNYIITKHKNQNVQYKGEIISRREMTCGLLIIKMYEQIMLRIFKVLKSIPNTARIQN